MLKCLAALIALGALLLGQPAAAESQEVAARAKAHGANVTQNPASAAGASAVPPIDTPCTGAKPAQDKSDATEKPLPQFLRPEWITVYITAIYVLIAYLTLHAIKRQSDLMKDQAKDARESATTAAVTAQQTLEALRRQVDSMENSERGRIAIEISRRGEFSLQFNAKNIGKTNARVTSISAFCEFIARGQCLPDLPEYLAESHDPNYMGTWLGAGDSIALEDDGKDSAAGDASLIADLSAKATRNNIAINGHSMWVFGRMRYLDGIAAQEREIRFCYAIGVDRQENTWAYPDGPSAYRLDT